MKLFKTIYLPVLLTLAVAVTSCVDDDNDDGPSSDPKGNMTGDLTIIDGGPPVESDWSSNDVTCFHDTLTNDFVVSTTDDSGDRIIMVLANGNVGNFQFQSFGQNISTYEKANSTDTINTQPNDILDPPSAGGLVTITTENYESSATISGDIISLAWVTVGPGDDDDETFGFIQNASFTDVPVTKGTNISTGGDATLNCTVDGDAFNAESVLVTTVGNTLSMIATNLSGQSVSITLPENASIGSHDIGGTSGYSATYSDGSTAFLGTSGTIVLTAVNISEATANGTFSFTGTDLNTSATVEVANGSFTAE